MQFTLEHTYGKARSGTVFTDHGVFHTPAFMPVGTQGTVKAVSQQILREIGVEVILSNTYHLYLRPGTEILNQAGGLHEFMGWDRPILTDSGGYQVFSLSDLRKIEEEGVQFRSHIDGSLHTFTPESVIDIQRLIGSDIMMVLDECIPYPCEKEYAESSNELTLRWAERCLNRFRSTDQLYGHGQSLFAIVQGSVFGEVRERSAHTLVDMGFEGYAIGGLAVGEPIEEMYDIVALCNDLLPREKPRYLMGVGTPENLLEAIDRGIDMFDCVLPTRNGRNAMLFTQHGSLNITNARFKNDFTPVDDSCECYTCRTYSRAYLRHLFQSKEVLGLQLATIHNLYFFQWLMRSARQAIALGNYSHWKEEQLNSLSQEIPVYS
ncbi:MAG: tRNA guanosine(34) transglycosylase Tgt [Ignavibacteria bacterium]|nr:tRNA guanosine(34) transglycosylase Tgt [Ignavibacteria bacterium]MBI3765549.1 tRNA guanosine(34) transglycosylase Tgt [Ignavibacteriales bacterium]